MQKAINFTEIINKNSQIDIKIKKIAKKNGQIQKIQQKAANFTEITNKKQSN